MNTKNNIAILLLTLLLSTPALSMFHSKKEHHHDSSCSVYVLEHQLLGADLPSLTVIPTVFVVFVLLLLAVIRPPFRAVTLFNSRAPPKPFL